MLFLKKNLLTLRMRLHFLECTLPESIKMQLQLSTLIYTDNSFITRQYQPLFTDIVFQCSTTHNEELYFSILVEHKSYKDSSTIFQIGAYLFEAYLNQLKKREPLKLVIPIIYYHGKLKWEFSKITDYFLGYNNHLFKYISDEVIMGMRNVVISSLLITQKYMYKLDMLLNKLNALYNHLQNEKEMNSFQENMVFIFIAQPSSKKIIELMESKQKTSFN